MGSNLLQGKQPASNFLSHASRAGTTPEPATSLARCKGFNFGRSGTFDETEPLITDHYSLQRTAGRICLVTLAVRPEVLSMNSTMPPAAGRGRVKGCLYWTGIPRPGFHRLTAVPPAPTPSSSSQQIRSRRLNAADLRVKASAAGAGFAVSAVPGSQTAAPATPEAPQFKWGADLKKLGTAVGVGTVLYFVPPPSGVTLQAWHLLAIFVGTIVGIVTQPLALGAVAMLGLAATMLTKTLTFPQAFTAFSSEIP